MALFVDLDVASAPRLQHFRGRPSRRYLLVMVVLGGVAFACGLWLAGLRWFVVETPSMAETAPVGTLVVTAPARTVAVGEIVAFRPPGLDRIYTHRVVAVLPSGAVHTRGDLNGADDGWTTPVSRVVGRAVALLPGAGFLTRAVPLLAGGTLLIWWATVAIRRLDRRASARIVGLHLLASLVLLFVHPLASISLLTTQPDGHRLLASVVSTGLLPIVLTAPSGQHLAALRDGQLATVPLLPDSHGHLALDALLDLAWWQQGLLLAATLIPAALVLLYGLPRHDPDDTDQPATLEAVTP